MEPTSTARSAVVPTVLAERDLTLYGAPRTGLAVEFEFVGQPLGSGY